MKLTHPAPLDAHVLDCRRPRLHLLPRLVRIAVAGPPRPGHPRLRRRPARRRAPPPPLSLTRWSHQQRRGGPAASICPSRWMRWTSRPPARPPRRECLRGARRRARPGGPAPPELPRTCRSGSAASARAAWGARRGLIADGLPAPPPPAPGPGGPLPPRHPRAHRGDARALLHRLWQPPRRRHPAFLAQGRGRAARARGVLGGSWGTPKFGLGAEGGKDGIGFVLAASRFGTAGFRGPSRPRRAQASPGWPWTRARTAR